LEVVKGAHQGVDQLLALHVVLGVRLQDMSDHSNKVSRQQRLCVACAMADQWYM
jgi:hypothetical protein